MSNKKHYNPQSAKQKRIEETIDILEQVLFVHKSIKPRTAKSVLYTLQDVLTNDCTVMVEDDLDGMIHIDVADEEKKNNKKN